MSTLTALVLTERVVALATGLQTIEFLRRRKSFDEGSLWSWTVLREDFSQWPRLMRFALDALLRARGFAILLLFRLLASFVALFASFGSAFGSLAIFILLFSTLLIALRWRGSFNGGSDAMTLQTLMVLGFAHIFRSRPFALEIALWYLTMQVCLSFFIAGLVKIKSSNWRSGQALQLFLAHPGLSVPDRAKFFVASPMRAKLLARAIIVFELVFPVVLFGPALASSLIALALAFHLVNFYVFGLNRFFFAWAAAYPAVLYCSQRFLGRF